MASADAERKELEDVKKRISNIMRDFAAEQQQHQNLLDLVRNASPAEVQLMSASASSASLNRQLAEPPDINTTVDDLQRQLIENEAAIGRLWLELADLQERERELKAVT